MNGSTNAPRHGANGHHAHANGHAHNHGPQNGKWNVDLFHCAPGGTVFNSIFQPCVGKS